MFNRIKKVFYHAWNAHLNYVQLYINGTTLYTSEEDARNVRNPLTYDEWNQIKDLPIRAYEDHVNCHLIIGSYTAWYVNQVGNLTKIDLPKDPDAPN